MWPFDLLHRVVNNFYTVPKTVGFYMREGAVLDTRKILIVEDEVEVRKEYKRLMKEKHPELCLAGETDNRREALSLLQNTSVDVIILDLELQGDNGTVFLKEMQELSIEKPFIIVVTKVVSTSLMEGIREMGVDTFCAKSGKGFTFDEPLALAGIAGGFRKAKSDAKTKKLADGASQADEASSTSETFSVDGTDLPGEAPPFGEAGLSGETLPADEADSRKLVLRKQIEAVLEENGFPSKKRGTNQCVEALLFMVLSGKKVISLSKDVYPHVARVCGTGEKSVEKNIRCVIREVWSQDDMATLRRMYPYSRFGIRKRPTNAEFLTRMAKKWM